MSPNTAQTSQNKLIYEGDLCSLDDDKTISSDKHGQGFITPPAHTGVGGQLPYTLPAGTSREYQLVIQPNDPKDGLPTDAQRSSTTVNLAFSGFDY